MVNFWDPEDSNIIDAHVTEVEDVFEDCLSELPEETSPHVEEEKKSDDEEKVVEEEKEETANFTKEAAPQEEKEDMSKVYGLFNSTSSTSKTQALVNVRKTRMPANLFTTTPVTSGSPATVMKRSSKVPPNLSTTFPMSANNVLGSSESPAALKKRSPFKVVFFADSELHRTTRQQEKVAMEEVKEGRKKVMQFSFLNSNILIYELNVTISVSGATVRAAQPEHLKEGEGSQEEHRGGGDGRGEEEEDEDCGIGGGGGEGEFHQFGRSAHLPQ